MIDSIQNGCITVTSLQEDCIMANTLNIEILNNVFGKKITCIGSEVSKAVIGSVNKKKTQNFFLSGGHQLKDVVIEN